MKKLNQFGKCAGLKTNKTEALWLGPPKRTTLHDILKLTNTSELPEILGIYFTYAEKLHDKLFDSAVESF